LKIIFKTTKKLNKMEKKCVFCDWERLYDERDKYDWNYVCPKCRIKCGLKTNKKIKNAI